MTKHTNGHTSIKDYLVHLSKHPHELEKYKKNPDAHIDATDLHDEDKKALKSGDPEQIRKRMGHDFPAGCVIIC